jgi:hypothetical protein
MYIFTKWLDKNTKAFCQNYTSRGRMSQQGKPEYSTGHQEALLYKNYVLLGPTTQPDILIEAVLLKSDS